MQTLRTIVPILMAIVLVVYMVNQCRKPRGWLGRFFLWEMGGRHSDLTDWGLSHVAIERHHTILDVGCGGGKTVSKLALLATEGKVCGVDYSAASVASSRRTNRHELSNGRVKIQHASVSQLPFADSTFDLVTAVETHYYWPDLVADMREILRVLKPQGKLVLIAEAYKRGRFHQPTGVAMRLLRASYLTVNEHRDLLVTAGFADVEIFEDRRKTWICVIGRKSDKNGEKE